MWEKKIEFQKQILTCHPQWVAACATACTFTHMLSPGFVYVYLKELVHGFLFGLVHELVGISLELHRDFSRPRRTFRNLIPLL